MKRVTITYERDEAGWWVASTDKIAGCHTQGRSISQARERFIEALELFVEDPSDLEFTEDIHIPAVVRRAVDSALEDRERADALQQKAQESTAAVARKLVLEHHLSVRDAGELLHLSHQRVQQLVPAKSKTSRPVRLRKKS